MKENNKKNKAKITGVRIMCWILAGLMVAGAATVLISAIITMIG